MRSTPVADEKRYRPIAAAAARTLGNSQSATERNLSILTISLQRSPEDLSFLSVVFSVIVKCPCSDCLLLWPL